MIEFKKERKNGLAYAIVNTKEDLFRALGPVMASIVAVKYVDAVTNPYNVEVRIKKPFGGSFIERVKINAVV